MFTFYFRFRGAVDVIDRDMRFFFLAVLQCLFLFHCLFLDMITSFFRRTDIFLTKLILDLGQNMCNYLLIDANKDKNSVEISSAKIHYNFRNESVD